MNHNSQSSEITLSGISKDEKDGQIIYFINELSDDLKSEIRKRLVSICYGVDQAQSSRIIYSYKATVNEFIARYKSDKNASRERKKGLIGELLVHVMVGVEGRFTHASPFFNLEERSFKKGFDIVLVDDVTKDIWITEVKSGEKQKSQANSSSAIVGLINTAKNDLNKRLNENDRYLWHNAINAANCAMSKKSSQKDAVVELLELYADRTYEQCNKSTDYNVVLAATLFHKMDEPVNVNKITKKHREITKDRLFKKVYLLVIQKETFEAVYDFLESEADT